MRGGVKCVRERVSEMCERGGERVGECVREGVSKMCERGGE